MFGLYPAGSEWIRTFAMDDQDMRDIQRSLVDHAGFTAAILHQPFGQQRGAVMAQSGQILVLSDTTPRARQIAVTPTVQMHHLLWSYREGYATQWSSMEIRSLTGFHGWAELLTHARREFSRTCEKVAAAIAGTLQAPVVTEVAADPMREPFPNDDDDAFYAQMAAIHDAQEVGSCAL
ncbi:hypothetical protein [Paraburkholderia sp. RL18-085-BIA-A]|uniref:hypothetical protein n=1 Tax=Paraburkholderia sp. RL18-085-BIA-A TaxID=3031633 RepID=UPI0038BB6BDB